MLQITEAGQLRVATLEFAEELERFVIAAKGLSIEEAIGKHVLVVQVAAELVGKGSELDFRTDVELAEFQQFILEHTEEINISLIVCLRMLKARSPEANPQNLTSKNNVTTAPKHDNAPQG
jgi:hypothetical protein